MYKVTIENEGQEILINSHKAFNGAPRLKSAQIKQGINVIDSFSFEILPNNPGYNLLNYLSTKVKVTKYLNNIPTVIFKGRVLMPDSEMNSSGQFVKKVLCESELAYLMDSSQVYGEYHDITVRAFLGVIINNHNAKVGTDKQFELGNVTVTDSNDSLYRFLNYEKTLNVIKDKLIDRLGGELQIRYENDVMYLDYLAVIGAKKNTIIQIAKNLESIKQNIEITNVISRLSPYGAKIGDTEERINISSVNGGSIYIDDEVSKTQFGIIEESVTYDDITLPSKLKAKAIEELAERTRVKVKYSITAKDLALIGLTTDEIEIYNTYPVYNPVMGIDTDLRVIERSIDLFNPQNSSISVGDKIVDIKDYQIKANKANGDIKSLTEKINLTNAKVINLSEDVQGVDGRVTTTETGIVTTNTAITKQQKYIIMGVWEHWMKLKGSM